MSRERNVTKIREYIEETKLLIKEFCSEGVPLERLLALYDAIEIREGDVVMWRAYGLTEDDEVPEAPKRLLFPSFELRPRCF